MNIEIAPNRAIKYLNLSDAIMYCFALDIDGKTGWRLPTNQELAEIIPHRVPWDWYWLDQNKLSTDEINVICKNTRWPPQFGISMVYCIYEDGSEPLINYEAWDVTETNMVIPVRDIK